MLKNCYLTAVVLFLINTLTFAQFDGASDNHITFVSYKAFEFSLPDSTGKVYKLSDYKGKVVLLDFWATWCGACIKQSKELNKLKLKFANNENVIFIQVSTDKEREKWINFLRKKAPTGIQLYYDNVLNTEVKLKYDIRYLPKTFLINQNGDVVLDPDHIEKFNLEDEINELLKVKKE